MSGNTVLLDWPHTYRVIPSQFPPINFFEDLVDPSLMEALFYVESLTNDRLRHEAGNIFLVPKEDRISGSGSSIVMAAFTHVSQDRPSRFSDGTYGVYYAAKCLETAIRERVYHSEKFLSSTRELPGTVTMRVYRSDKILQPLIDIRHPSYAHLHESDNYFASRAWGAEVKRANHWGLIYRSVRHMSGECVAIFRPPAVPLPVIQTQHYQFDWNGKNIISAIEIGGTIFTF